jgi:hypothetical protein
MPLFLQGAPLEHLRFRCGVVREDLDDERWQRLCDETWLIDSRCEMQRVLDLYTLQSHVREGLRVVLLMLERFGARSVLVEYIATLQWNERVTRAERLAAAVDDDAVTALQDPRFDLDAWFAGWISATGPHLLTSADYVALWLAPDDLIPFLWLPDVTLRISDYCLDQLEHRKGSERGPWSWLTHMMMLGPKPEIASLLMHQTSLRSSIGVEEKLREVLTPDARGSDLLEQALAEIVPAVVRLTERGGDYGGAALIRRAVGLAMHGCYAVADML